MAQKIPSPPPGFDDLSVEDKLDYVQSLWDRIAAKPEAIPVPDWHLQLLEERLDENRASSRATRSWDDFREELRAKMREQKPRR